MKKTAFVTLVVFVCTLSYFNRAQAVGVGSQFSGIITFIKAKEITALEGDGYTCPVKGTSIEILKKGKKGYQPSRYLIPEGTISKTKHSPAIGQKIKGKYGGTTSIECIHPDLPPITVTLDNIILYGNSAR